MFSCCGRLLRASRAHSRTTVCLLGPTRAMHASPPAQMARKSLTRRAACATGEARSAARPLSRGDPSSI